MKVPGPYPFRGEVIWLTPEQGGRSGWKGIPQASDSYAATAFVPPETAETGLASFVVRDFDPTEHRSRAQGRWLLVENEGAQLIVPGTVVVVTEGASIVGFFFLHDVVSN